MPERTVIRDVLSIYVPAFFVMTGISIVSPILSIYARSFGVSYTLATLAVSSYAVGRLFTNLLITVPMGYALDRFGRKAVLVPSLVASAVVAVLFVWTTDFTQLAVVCILLGLSTRAGGQAPLAMASDATMQEAHGLAMGLYRVFGDIGFIVGPLLVGVIADGAGLQWPFYAIAIVISLAVVFIQGYAKETYTRHARV